MFLHLSPCCWQGEAGVEVYLSRFGVLETALNQWDDGIPEQRSFCFTNANLWHRARELAMKREWPMYDPEEVRTVLVPVLIPVMVHCSVSARVFVRVVVRL